MITKDYTDISTKNKYEKILYSGMFWVSYPELTGVWSKDKLTINNNMRLIALNFVNRYIKK